MDEQYMRQETIPLDIPENVTIIGCGGIGTWVAFGLALCGVKKMTLIDNDVIENHNLNRTIYYQYEVGSMKATALASHINEVRPNCEITTITHRTDKMTPDELAAVNESVVIDCRDNIRALDGIKAPFLKAGYDGTKVTIQVNPRYDGIIGNPDGAYTVVPSWVGTPMLIAGICLHEICRKVKDDREQLVSFDAMNTVSQIAKGAVVK